MILIKIIYYLLFLTTYLFWLSRTKVGKMDLLNSCVFWGFHFFNIIVFTRFWW